MEEEEAAAAGEGADREDVEEEEAAAAGEGPDREDDEEGEVAAAGESADREDDLKDDAEEQAAASDEGAGQEADEEVVETMVHKGVQIAALRREFGRRTRMSPTRPRSTAVCEECSLRHGAGLVAIISPAGRQSVQIVLARMLRSLERPATGSPSPASIWANLV